MKHQAPESHPVEEYIGTATWSLIQHKFSPYAKELLTKVIDFVMNDCLPAEATYYGQIPQDPATRWKAVPPIIEELKAKAKSLGLWNMFMSQRHYPDLGVPLTTLEYAVMCEILGWSVHIAPVATNCSAPDTGNMEVLAKFGNKKQQEQWLKPLMEGKTRSAFSMTEKGKCSSDAKNVSGTIRKEGNEFVINAHKHWISNAGHPNCAVHILVGQTDPDNPDTAKRQSVVLVPANAPGVKLIRPLSIMGYDDAPEGHFEVIYENVRVPVENLVAGYGRGFEVLQGRLGPGRIHHAMRGLGQACRALDLMLQRATDPTRKTFGKQLFEHGTVVADIAQMRIDIDQTRYLVLQAANAMDDGDAKSAMKEISMSKIASFVTIGTIIDKAIQIHGGEGLDSQHPLAYMFAYNRHLRFADGPDEVHRMQLGKMELKRAAGVRAKHAEQRQKSEALLKKNGIASKF